MHKYPTLNSLGIGDRVYLWEAGDDDLQLTQIVTIQPTRLCVARCGPLEFDRDTGMVISSQYKRLITIQEAEQELITISRREDLASLIERYAPTQEQFEKCYRAIEQILGD